MEEAAMIESIMKKINYPMWFTDTFCKDYILSFPQRYKAAKAQKNLQAQSAIFAEARMTTWIYCMLVYHAYPNRPEFKKTIDSDPQLLRNFNMVRDYLEKNNGRQAAVEFLAFIMKQQAT